MSMNPVYVASKGSINHDGNITNKIYQNTNISSRGTQYRTLSSPGHSVLMQSAFIISSLISLVLVICFLWMRWREYRARIYEVRHVRQTSGDNTINEEVEKRLRRKILEILPTKVEHIYIYVLLLHFLRHKNLLKSIIFNCYGRNLCR